MQRKCGFAAAVGSVLLVMGASSVSAATVRQVGPDGNVYDVPVYQAPEGAVIPDSEGPSAYGIGSATYFYPSTAFQVMNSSDDHFAFGPAWYRHSTGTGAYLYADFNVPSGAIVGAVRLYYYDNSASTAPAFYICKVEVDDSIGTNPTSSCPYVVAGDAAAAPGYTSIAISSFPTMDRSESGKDIAWFLAVFMPGDTEVAMLGVRTVWWRQISPAPATATFLDVPVGAFGFQHIEALNASGITAGCGGGNFCPNDLLTRAQMAVFLAKALGLHFPN